MNKDLTGVQNNDADNLVYLYPAKKNKADKVPVGVTFKKSGRDNQGPLVNNFVLRQPAGQSLSGDSFKPRVRTIATTLSLVRNSDR